MEKPEKSYIMIPAEWRKQPACHSTQGGLLEWVPQKPGKQCLPDSKDGGAASRMGVCSQDGRCREAAAIPGLQAVPAPHPGPASPTPREGDPTLPPAPCPRWSVQVLRLQRRKPDQGNQPLTKQGTFQYHLYSIAV